MPVAKLVLLLGSYDPKTREILDGMKKRLVTTFHSEDLFVFVMDSVRSFIAGPYQILVEELNEKHSTIFLFEQGELSEVEEIMTNGALEDALARYVEEHYEDLPISEQPIFDKLATISFASKATILIKDQEETRGGELVELSYLAMKFSSEKFWFLKRTDISLSTMVKELLTMLHVGFRVYSSREELEQETIRIVRYAL